MASSPLAPILAPWLLGALGCACANGPRTITRIPFTLTAADNLSVRAMLNEHEPLDLMFHTAVDGVALTQAAIARLARFHADGQVAVQSWGGTAQARQSVGNTLRIGELTFRDVVITEDLASGPGTDGKFGPSLFAGRVVAIDFDARELAIHDALPALDSRYDRLDLVVRHGAPFVTGEVVFGERACPVELMLHTGYSGTLLLDEAFVAANAHGAPLETIRERALQDSYGNTIKTRTVRLPRLRLGPLSFANVPVEVFPGRLGSERVSVVGSGLLKRCNLVLDLARAQVHLARNRESAAPFGA